MLFQFLVLFLDALDELEDYRVLVVEVVHDVTDFLFAFAVDEIVVLCGEAVFFRLAILGHHHKRRSATNSLMSLLLVNRHYMSRLLTIIMVWISAILVIVSAISLEALVAILASYIWSTVAA
jgi:hypothetical protein